MIHIYYIPSQSLLPSPLKLKDVTSPNETINVCVYYVCSDLTFLSHILFSYYLSSFVYECAAEFVFHFTRLYISYTSIHLSCLHLSHFCSYYRYLWTRIRFSWPDLDHQYCFVDCMLEPYLEPLNLLRILRGEKLSRH